MLMAEVQHQVPELIALETVDSVACVLEDLEPGIGQIPRHDDGAASPTGGGILPSCHYQGRASYLL